MIITFEGGDQAGKKTQSAMLQRKLRSAKLKVKLFSFPDYTTPIGKEIDRYLHGKRKYPAQVIHCLLAANRWERANDVIKAHEKNSVVIMNRDSESPPFYRLLQVLHSLVRLPLESSKHSHVENTLARGKNQGIHHWEHR